MVALDWVDGEITALRRAYLSLRPERRRLEERCLRRGAAPVIPLLLHPPGRRPAGRGRRTGAGAAILYCHGGGWYLGSPLTHAAIGRALAAASGLPVYSLGYRLMPGHSASAPVRDGLAALRGLIEGGHRRIVLAGDSAGAAVALGVARFAPLRCRRYLRGVVAFYGAYGLQDSAAIRAHGRREEGLDAAALAAAYRRLGRIGGPHPFQAALLAARRLPPLHLFVGDRDPLLDDSRALQAMMPSGSEARLTLVPDVGHSFLHAVAESPAARETLAAAARSIGNWVGRRP